MKKKYTDIELKEKRKEWDKVNHRKYRKNHPDRVREAGRKYRNTHKELLHKLRDEYLTNHPEWKLFQISKARAKRLGIKFSIVIDDIYIPKYCPLLGLKLTNVRGRGRVSSNVSLDRIDPTKGYVKGNIQVISELANRMKNNATVKQLLTFSNNIIKIYS